MADTITTNLGGVSAYLDAVKHGFVGTREEFGEYIATVGENARQAHEDAQSAENAKDDAIVAKESAEQSATDASDSKDSAAQSASDAIDAKNTAVSAKNDAVEARGVAVEAKESATQSASNASQAAEYAGSVVEGLAESADAQIERIVEKGAETLASIPDDYSAVLRAVAELQIEVLGISDLMGGGNRMNLKEKTISLIGYINDAYATKFDNLTEAVQYAVTHGGGHVVKKWYAHYMGCISEFDGYYCSHNYDAVFIKDGILYVFYTHAPHHFTSKLEDTTALYLCKYDTRAHEVISNTEVIRPARCFWHGYEVGGTYYLISEHGDNYLLKTTDFEHYTEETWTAPSGFGNINYICVGANDRLICTTGRTYKGCYIYYSDDLGHSWTKASGFDGAVTTHGGLARVGDKIVCYCQDSYGGTDHSVKRMVLVSDDNGATWTGKECIDEDLLDCGDSYASGAFCKVDDTWFFATSRRCIEKLEDGCYHLGDIRLFSGTEEDVLRGSMKLFRVLDDFNTGASDIGQRSTILTDSGNLGMRTDGESLYCVYHKPLLHTDDSSLYFESNSMTVLSVIDNLSSRDRADAFYDPDWMEDTERFIEDKSDDYDLFAYHGITNFGNGLLETSIGDVFPEQPLIIPFEEEFEIRAVAAFMNRMAGSWQQQYIGANIGGKNYVFGGDVNRYSFNATESSGGCALGGIKGGGKPEYNDFALRYKDGTVSVRLNGRTIEDCKMWEMARSVDIPENSIYVSFGAVTEPLTRYGIKALAVKTDGDVSPFKRYRVERSGDHCSWSNMDDLVSGAYICKVTPDDGYELKELTYTMGGIRHTAEGDTIRIAEVNGKLVITAVIAQSDLRLTTDGLIAYYNIGDASKYTDGWYVASDVQTDAVAWTGKSSPTSRPTQGKFPANLHDGYANDIGGMQIVFGKPLSEIGDTVTVEYIYANDYSNPSLAVTGSIKATEQASVSKTWELGFDWSLVVSSRVYAHYVVVLDATGNSKTYVNGELRRTGKALTNTMAVTCIGAGGNTAKEFLGHVRVYDKELTPDEVAQNFAWFTANCKVGQRAYDDDGNFVG